VYTRVTFGNGGCSGRVALGAAYELRKAHHIDALIGLPCSVGKNNRDTDTCQSLTVVKTPPFA